MAKSSNYSISVDVDLNLKDIDSQLKSKKYGITLDTAQTEFKKVSDLTGAALDSYTQKLANMGKEVGRTGKPNRSEPVCCDGKAA